MQQFEQLDTVIFTSITAVGESELFRIPTTRIFFGVYDKQISLLPKLRVGFNVEPFSYKGEDKDC
jgi:hypothetical protein